MTPFFLIFLGLLVTAWSSVVTYANLAPSPTHTALHHEPRKEFVTREVAEDARLRQGESGVTVSMHLEQLQRRSK